jgi:hypothetical protein
MYLDSVLGSQLVRRLNRTKCNRCDTLTAFFFSECKLKAVYKLLGIGNQEF